MVVVDGVVAQVDVVVDRVVAGVVAEGAVKEKRLWMVVAQVDVVAGVVAAGDVTEVQAGSVRRRPSTILARCNRLNT
jgi:hypothetical protein